ncbi:hypothetical protein M3P05_16590 [Sansalvadorimonas sp. 2012CJ34-2]|uniref:Uncharacterized protein n=1 Tax=Parendozoicomonas callyspongiae TaxID=2942213 RepID=A0ABT0PJG0_9GAMM|nr:hypothetical protein [Sansalvadorimonas sp. 2012CJ34-2]MCL6271535.1 hypothetical protein [Sansalvadorimonas sp. 2012CJ34-2]
MAELIRDGGGADTVDEGYEDVLLDRVLDEEVSVEYELTEETSVQSV